MIKLNRKEIKDIVTRYNSLETLGKICKDYNTHHHFIRKILINNGVKMRTKEEVMWKGYMDIGATFISSLEGQCKRLKLICNITIEEVWDIYIKQHKKCAISGQDINFKGKTVFLARNSKNDGYTKTNTLLVCKEVSIMKRRFNMEDFLMWCNRISNKKETFNIIEIYEQYRNYKGYKNISKNLWLKIADGAKNRKIILEVDIKQCWDRYEKQNGCCNLTGLPIYFSRSKSDYAGRTASLDRIDNTKGYMVDNIQWIHKDLNKMKYTLDNDLFIETAKLVANYRK